MFLKFCITFACVTTKAQKIAIKFRIHTHGMFTKLRPWAGERTLVQIVNCKKYFATFFLAVNNKLHIFTEKKCPSNCINWFVCECLMRCQVILENFKWNFRDLYSSWMEVTSFSYSFINFPVIVFANWNNELLLKSIAIKQMRFGVEVRSIFLGFHPFLACNSSISNIQMMLVFILLFRFSNLINDAKFCNLELIFFRWLRSSEWTTSKMCGWQGVHSCSPLELYHIPFQFKILIFASTPLKSCCSCMSTEKIHKQIFRSPL